jgi:uncharacterized protein (DUF362 family)
MASVSLSKVSTPLDYKKVEEALKKAIEKLGGIEKFIKKGERVLLKPNFVSPRPPPVTTDLRVIRAVASLVKEAGGKPIIGESSSAMTHWWREGMNTRDVMDLLGVFNLAKELNIEAVALEEKGWEITEITDAVVMKKAELSKLALEVDKIIPIPILKASMEGGGITCSMKVLHALVKPGTDRVRWHRSDLWQKLIDLMKVFRKKIPFCVVDGIKGMEGDGPIHGDPVDMNVIIVGDDPVATDAIAAKAIGFEYPLYEVGPIALAHTQGLGEGDPNKIRVVGAKVDEVKKRFKMASCEIIAPNFENVVVYEGAADRSCLAWIKFTLYMLKDTDLFDELKRRNKKLLFFVGLNPPLPEDLNELRKLCEQGVVIVFGDCATFSTRNSYWLFTQGDLKGKVLLMPGCPPFATAQQATQIREALGLEITEREKEAFKYVPT